MVPLERALVNSYRPSIVTFLLFLRVLEILPLLCSTVATQGHSRSSVSRGVARGGLPGPSPESTTRKNFKRINTENVQKNNAILTIFAQFLLILAHFSHFCPQFSGGSN